MIRVALPAHLRTLAKVSGEVTLDIPPAVTTRALLETLETTYPVLRGTVRNYGTLERRPWVRFFVCGEDWSHDPVDKLLPDDIVGGREPFMIVGAIAGGSS